MLGPDLGRVAREYWGVSREGNWEGKNILNVGRPDEEVAGILGLTTEELHEKLSEAADRLYGVSARNASIPGWTTRC